MKEVSISNQAQQALVKLLCKVNLLEAEPPLQEYINSDYCPIAHFTNKGCFEEEDALRIIAEALKIPHCVIDKQNTPKLLKALEHESVAKISLARWKEIRAIPFEVTAGKIRIAMANPLDQESKNAIEFDLGVQVTVGIESEGKILSILSQRLNSSPLFDLDSILGESSLLSDTIVTTPSQAQMESSVLPSDIGAAPIVRLVNKIFADSVQAAASDIHITPENDCVVVRIRVDGILQPLLTIPNALKNQVLSRIKLLCGMDIAERRKPQDGRIRLKTGFGTKDLRISSVPAIHGENIVARILSSDLMHITFSSLGMSPTLQEKFSRSLRNSSRVILVSGPTGSGKTSSLYASLLYLRDGTSNIVTIEDPIEYRIGGVTQIQVNSKVNMTFAEGLRSILRQDPDVIMVGEVRDAETASIAMQTAQTGHLVLSTIHTNTAVGAITRLRDLKIPSYLIASSVGGVLAQRLVRKLCTACARPLSGANLERWGAAGFELQGQREACGCAECGSTGYRGRTAFFSFLDISDAVREVIRAEGGEPQIEECAESAGFLRLEEAGFALVKEGVTSLDELERVVGPVDLLKLVEGGRIAPSIARGVAETRGAAPLTSLSKRRVLLVEDDEHLRAVLSLLLERQMFDVIEASDGEEALLKVYEHLPQLIVCDLMMPKMSGLEVLQKLRHDPRTREIPVLMLTALDSEENELNLIAHGADDFVSKTTDTKIMLARIHRLLERAVN